MEVVRGGFSSSALSTGQESSDGQAIGIYLTDRRLIITIERTRMGWPTSGETAPGFGIGRDGFFLRNEPRTVDELDAADKRLDVPVQEIAHVELKPPGMVFGGRLEVKLKSGKSFKVYIADRTHEYSKMSFLTAADLLERYLPVTPLPKHGNAGD